MIASVQEAVWEVDPEQPIEHVAALGDIVSESVSEPRFSTMLIGGFAVLALVLASIGIYGVVAYAVGTRTREIGIRIALGAGAAEVVSLVARRAMTWTIVGVAIGLLGALAVGRLIGSLLYDVTAWDPLTYVGTAVVLVVVALAASVIPARRAASVDPIAALRSE